MAFLNKLFGLDDRQRIQALTEANKNLSLSCTRNCNHDLQMKNSLLKSQIEALTAENVNLKKKNAEIQLYTNEWQNSYNELARECGKEEWTDAQATSAAEQDFLANGITGGLKCKKYQSRSRKTGRCRIKSRKTPCKSGKTRRGTGRCHKMAKETAEQRSRRLEKEMGPGGYERAGRL